MKKCADDNQTVQEVKKAAGRKKDDEFESKRLRLKELIERADLIRRSTEACYEHLRY